MMSFRVKQKRAVDATYDIYETKTIIHLGLRRNEAKNGTGIQPFSVSDFPPRALPWAGIGRAVGARAGRLVELAGHVFVEVGDLFLVAVVPLGGDDFYVGDVCFVGDEFFGGL